MLTSQEVTERLERSSISAEEMIAKNRFRGEKETELLGKIFRPMYMELPKSVKEKDFKMLLENEFMNPSVIVFTSSLLYGLFDYPPEIMRPYRVREWFRNLGVIGGGRYGDVFKTISRGTELFAIKNFRCPQNAIHEFIAGILLNDLRRRTPNFMLTFEYYTCSPPISYKFFGKGMCLGTDKSTFIVSELLPNVTLGNSLRGMNASEFANLFVQCMYAIRTANISIDFSHNDLHANNILIRRIPRSSIEYDTERGREYLETEYVAVIIDYGLSHFEVDGIPYDEYRLRSVGGVSGIGYPMGDAYKLILSCYWYIRGFNDERKVLLEDLFYFFTTEPMNKFADEQADVAFVLPKYSAYTRPETFDDFLKHMRATFDSFPWGNLKPPIFTGSPTLPVLGCKPSGDQDCMTVSEIEQRLLSDIPPDTFTIYDRLVRIEGATSEEFWDESLKVISDDLDRFLDEMPTIEDRFLNTPLVSLEIYIRRGSRVNENSLVTYFGYLSLFLSTYDFYVDVKVALISIKSITGTFPEEVVKKHRRLLSWYNSLVPISRDLLNMYKKDAEKIERFSLTFRANISPGFLPYWNWFLSPNGMQRIKQFMGPKHIQE